jgi:hypothetical protein
MFPTLVCLTALFGCAGPDDYDDAADDRDASFAQGKADGAAPEEGSPIALGVLRLANEASYETLDDPISQGGVGLDRRAAAGIVDRRDVAPFETLAQLDAVPYVGPVALSRMTDFALDNDYVEPDLRVGELSTVISYRGCNDHGSGPYCHRWQSRVASTAIEVETVDGEPWVRGTCNSAFGVVEFEELLPAVGEPLTVVTHTFEYGSISDRTQSCIYTPQADGTIEVIFDWTAYTYSTDMWRQGMAEGTVVLE